MKMKKLALTVASTAVILGVGASHHVITTQASSMSQTTIVDKVTKLGNHVGHQYFETKYGWEEDVRKGSPVKIGDTLTMELNTNGHSPNIEDWYTENYTVIKHK